MKVMQSEGIFAAQDGIPPISFHLGSMSNHKSTRDFSIDNTSLIGTMGTCLGCCHILNVIVTHGG